MLFVCVNGGYCDSLFLYSEAAFWILPIHATAHINVLTAQVSAPALVVNDKE